MMVHMMKLVEPRPGLTQMQTRMKLLLLYQMEQIPTPKQGN